MKLKPIPLVVGAVFLAIVGVVHGVRTNRWGPSVALQQAVARMDRVPSTVGFWKSEPIELNATQRRIGQIAGYCGKVYTNPTTGETVTVILVCGRPGHIAVHTPDVCFRGAGFAMTTPPSSHSISGGKGRNIEFMTAPFTKPGPVPQKVRVFWAWSVDGQWQAPKRPRVAFFGDEYLYKLYLVSANPDPKQPLEESPSLRFLELLQPKLSRVLSPGE